MRKTLFSSGPPSLQLASFKDLPQTAAEHAAPVCVWERVTATVSTRVLRRRLAAARVLLGPGGHTPPLQAASSPVTSGERERGGECPGKRGLRKSARDGDPGSPGMQVIYVQLRVALQETHPRVDQIPAFKDKASPSASSRACVTGSFDPFPPSSGNTHRRPTGSTAVWTWNTSGWPPPEFTLL